MLYRHAFKRAKINIDFFLCLPKKEGWLQVNDIRSSKTMIYIELHFATCATTLLCELSGHRTVTIANKTYNSLIAIVVGYMYI